MKIGCVVLAAGRSERYGEDKLRHLLRGVPVLTRTLAALPEERLTAVAPVVSTAAAEQLCAAADFRAVRYDGGPVSESIRLGLRALPETDGCLFVNGDQPLIARSTLERMLDAFERDPSAVVRASLNGQGASPAIFPAAAYPALDALRGENGGRRVIREGNLRVIPVEVSSEYEMLDVDTPAQMERAERFLESGTAGDGGPGPG